MELRVLTDAAERALAPDDASSAADLVHRFGAGTLFGTFELSPEAANEPHARVRARPSGAWWPHLSASDLGSCKPFAVLTHGRGVVVRARPGAEDERLVVCTTNGASLVVAPTLAGLFLAADRIAFRCVAPAAGSKVDVPVVPLTFDTRSTRGVARYVEALLSSDEDRADALLPALLDTHDPLLALYETKLALDAAGQSSRAVERLGARRGQRWTDRLAQSTDASIADPVGELADAGFGTRTPAEGVLSAREGAPRSVVAIAREALDRWRAFDASAATWLHGSLAALSAEDVYLVLRALGDPPERRDADADAAEQASLRACWRSPLALVFLLHELLSNRRMLALEPDTWPGALPAIDAILARVEAGAAEPFAFRTGAELLAKRIAMGPFDPAQLAALHEEFLAFARAPSGPTRLFLRYVLRLVEHQFPASIAELSAEALAFSARPGAAAELVDVLTKAGHVRGLVALARTEPFGFWDRAAAAEAAIALGEPDLTALRDQLVLRARDKGYRRH